MDNPPELNTLLLDEARHKSRSRRCWSDEQKLSILREACESGNSVSSIAKKHGIAVSQLFQWRRQFENGAGTPRRVRSAQEECVERLERVQDLQRLEHILMTRLLRDVRSGGMSAYNASIAFSNLVNGHTKLSALTTELSAQLQTHERTIAEDTSLKASPEEQRAAERMLLEFVRQFQSLEEGTGS